MTTKKQKRAVAFIFDCIGIRYNGDIEDYVAVTRFIGTYLAEARRVYDTYNMLCNEAQESYPY